MEMIADKLSALLDRLNAEGYEFTSGQYALVCDDAVVILDISEDSCNISMINNRLDIDFTFNVTDADVEKFLSEEALLEEFEEALNEC